MIKNRRKQSQFIKTGLIAVSLIYPYYGHAASIAGYFNSEFNLFNLGGPKNADPQQNPPYGNFDLERVGLIFQHDQEIFKFYSQIQFTHGAEFTDNGDGAGTNTSHDLSFGEIALERTWIQAKIDPAFNLKIGKEITPTLWQRAQYPSVYTPITVPQIVKNVFDEYIVGITASGMLPAGFTYDLWIQNSQNTTAIVPNTGPLPDVGHQLVTDNRVPALSEGGRIGWLNEDKDYSVYFGFLGANYNDIPPQTATGFETALKYKGLGLWAELNNEAHNHGWYVLPSYTIALTDESDITPYILYDNFQSDEVGPDNRCVIAAGLNYKPKPFLTIKGEGVRTLASNNEPASSAVRFGLIYFFN